MMAFRHGRGKQKGKKEEEDDEGQEMMPIHESPQMKVGGRSRALPPNFFEQVVEKEIELDRPNF